jgi:hypothetical protein
VKAVAPIRTPAHPRRTRGLSEPKISRNAAVNRVAAGRMRTSVNTAPLRPGLQLADPCLT